jgi:spore germination cell wall hydrolase CwlJ-like protein
MDENHLAAAVLFSETKDIEDAKGIMSVIMNRTKRPDRFGATITDVVLAPYQFSGVNSPEFQKAATLKFKNKDEEGIFKQFLSIVSSAKNGTLEDKTDGSDHYVNLKLAKPSWIKKMTKKNKIGEHTYFKE